MKVTLKVLAISASAVAVGFAVAQQRSTPQTRPNRPAETSLVGVNIFDTGMLLLDMFGSPNELQPLSIGGGGVGTGGAPGAGAPSGGGAGGFNGSGAPQRRKNLPAAGSISGGSMIGDPFGASRNFNQNRGGGGAAGNFDVDLGSDSRGVPGGGGGGGTGGGGTGGGGASAGGGGRVLYTRWIYDRPASKYSFVVDKFNRVVQIEAIGIKDQSVVSSRGIGFGSSFADVLRAYNVPDAYEISGDSIVMRYLVRDHVAFRLSRLKEDDPHRVTGVVVSAGKQ